MRRLRSLSLLLALLLVAALPAVGQNVNGFLQVNPDRLQGTDLDDRLLIYAPAPVQPGSSISHWDTSASPDLLMEPFLGNNLNFLDLDISPNLMRDLGWEPGSSQFTVFDLDAPGTGLTDPRPFPGAPGNDAATLGEARQNLIDALLSVWGSTLDSSVPIDVLVTFYPLACSPDGAALAAASTLSVFADDSLPVPDVWYPAALTEAIVGIDLTGPPTANSGGDVIVLMNSQIDEGCLGPGTGFYYGLDGNPPNNQIDAASTMLHELGHGVGMQSFTDETTGAGFMDRLSLYDAFLFDNSQGRTWLEMTDAQRVDSALNTGGLVWNGDNVTAATGDFLEGGVPELVIRSPQEVAGAYAIGLAEFGAPVTSTRVRGDLACLETVSAGGERVFDGCTGLDNPNALAGKIALIERGECTFVEKARNAQDAGAIAAIIYNNAGSANGLGGDDPSITIPVVSVGFDDGMRLRDAACGSTELFLTDSRFQVTAQWRTPDGDEGVGRAVQLTNDTGYFWFFSADNVEAVVKVLDGCAFNDHFWVFAGGLTNVEVTLTVTDTQTLESRIFVNPLDTPFQPIQDTRAFATCPDPSP